MHAAQMSSSLVVDSLPPRGAAEGPVAMKQQNQQQQQQRGQQKNKDKMNFIGGKIPAALSLRGSNALRGGRRTYNAMCLNDNWYEERLNPRSKEELRLYTAADDRPSHAPFGPWASEYSVAFSKGNWKHQPVHIASSDTLFAVDDTGPRDWTTCYRHDFRNRQQEEVNIRKKELQEQQQRAAAAEQRLQQAEEARAPQWPMTPDAAARLSALRQGSGGAAAAAAAAAPTGRAAAEGYEEYAEQQEEEEEQPEDPYALRLGECSRDSSSSSNNNNNHEEQKGNTRFVSFKDNKCNEEETADLAEKMEDLSLNPHSYRAAGKPTGCMRCTTRQ